MSWLLLCALLAPSAEFARAQNAAPRVREAREQKIEGIQAAFAALGVAYPPRQMLLRAFKATDALEVWVGDAGAPLRLLKTYPVCARSGGLGPKRARGDLQVPEGFYRLTRFNPTSNFHLSLGLDYPNRSDRTLGARDPGGDIFIHGSCVTIGCLPIEDEAIKELYVIALDTHIAGRPIHVHVFPRPLDDAGMTTLASEPDVTPELLRFWEGLRPGFLAFEATHAIPDVRVGAAGVYRVR